MDLVQRRGSQENQSDQNSGRRVLNFIICGHAMHCGQRRSGSVLRCCYKSAQQTHPTDGVCFFRIIVWPLEIFFTNHDEDAHRADCK